MPTVVMWIQPKRQGPYHMRPNKTQSDLEYWSNAIQHWTEVEEFYFLNDDRAGEARAAERKYRAILAHQEAQGLIVVYTGRAKPKYEKWGVVA